MVSITAGTNGNKSFHVKQKMDEDIDNRNYVPYLSIITSVSRYYPLNIASKEGK
jgi:hypothetical protein